MYANLAVTGKALEDHPLADQYGKVYAYSVEIGRERVRIRTDKQDGNGSYAEPGPIIEVPRTRRLTITADF